MSSNQWQEIPLGEICQIDIGGTPSRSKDSYWWNSQEDGERFPWVSISDMKERVINKTRESITKLGKERSNVKYVKKGTLLMSFKLTVGRLAFAGIDLFTNEAIAALKTTEVIDCNFLYYGLQYWNLMGDTDQAVKGVTLNKQKLQEVICTLPPLPEQKKIAKILSGIDSLSSRFQELKRKKKDLFSALLIDIFDRLTSCATPTRIGDICEVKRGASPRPIQDKRYWGNGRGWTRISDVTNARKYLFSTKDRLSREGEEKSVPINPGEIILSICATIGLPIIVKTPVCIHDGFVWFDGASTTVNSEYMYYYFLSIRKHLLSGRQTGTQGNLNTSIVADQIIPIPSRETQDKVVDMMSNIEDQI